MATYESELVSEKKFVGNVVIHMLGEYFTIHTPDSGLTPKVEYRGIVGGLVVNPTTIDPRRVSTTIESRTFKLLDKNGVISALIGERAESVAVADVRIWIGRIGVSMAFSDYYELPATQVNKITKTGEYYSISTTGDSDRINRPIFSRETRLSGDILSSTDASITVKDDISQFPSSGYIRIGKEFIGYASKNDATKQFITLTRGEFTTTPADYEDDETIYMAGQVTDNPLNIILRLLSSGGGGGTYDDLDDGVGLTDSLIDIDDIELLRDSLFVGVQFTLAFYNITKALTFIEKELLAPCNLRFTYSRGSKLTVAILDKAKFVESIDIIDDDTVKAYPQWTVDKNKIVNTIDIQWDYNEATGAYEQSSSYRDEDSITAYGENNSPLRLQFKGVKAALDGQEFVDSFAEGLLDRLSLPSPEIQVRTHIDKSLFNVGDKSVFESNKIPNSAGRLNFSSELEIISRAINFETGEVTHKLAFTSFSDIRTCYIAPSDAVVVVTSQSIIEVGTDRGAGWDAGWRCRLWDTVANAYATDQTNEIESIDGDEITFVDDWDVTLSTDHELRFPDYDNATREQKRYCYTAEGTDGFEDGGKTYSIVP